MKEIGTRDRIIDAAARRFARDGVGATSIRAVIRDADANLNAVHYHFGSKLRLMQAVWAWTIAPIMKERRTAVSRLPRPHTARDVLDALYGPLLKRAASPRSAGGRGLLILAQIRVDPSKEARAVLDSHEDDLAPTFDTALAGALRCTPDQVRAVIGLINGAMWDHATQQVLAAQAGVAVKVHRDRLIELADAWLRLAIKQKEVRR